MLRKCNLPNTALHLPKLKKEIRRFRSLLHPLAISLFLQKVNEIINEENEK